MAIWAGIKGLFAGSESVGSVIDATINGVDAAWFTDQEKQNWYLKYLNSTLGQNRARRMIAVIVTALWAALVVLGIVAWLLSEDAGEFIFSVLRDVVMPPFTVIIGFYYLRSLVPGAHGK